MTFHVLLISTALLPFIVQAEQSKEISPYIDLVFCPAKPEPWSCARQQTGRILDVWDEQVDQNWQKLKVEADQQYNATLERRGYSSSEPLTKERPSTILKKIEIGTNFMKDYLAETFDGFLGREYNYGAIKQGEALDSNEFLDVEGESDKGNKKKKKRKKKKKKKKRKKKKKGGHHEDDEECYDDYYNKRRRRKKGHKKGQQESEHVTPPTIFFLQNPNPSIGGHTGGFQPQQHWQEEPKPQQVLLLQGNDDVGAGGHGGNKKKKRRKRLKRKKKKPQSALSAIPALLTAKPTLSSLLLHKPVDDDDDDHDQQEHSALSVLGSLVSDYLEEDDDDYDNGHGDIVVIKQKKRKRRKKPKKRKKKKKHKNPIKYGRDLGVTRGKKKKKKKAIMKLVLLGTFLKGKIELLLKILGAHLQIKFLAIALIGLLINIARFWLDLKRGGSPQKVVYVEHAHHQHHYEDHGDDWGEQSGGYWKRSIQNTPSAVEPAEENVLPYQVPTYDPHYMAYRSQLV